MTKAVEIVMPPAVGIIDHGGPLSVPQLQKSNAFHQLVLDLKAILNRSPGAKFSDIDPGPILTLMEKYQSEKTHWLDYAYGNKDHCFTRNLVDHGNGNWNLVCSISPVGVERMALIDIARPSLEPRKVKSDS